MTERWIAVPEFEGRYEVSDQGRIRSLDMLVMRRDGRSRRQRGRVLAAKTPGERYAEVNLVRSDGTRRKVDVHVVVAEAFHGPRPPGLEVRHDDGNARNNRADNLIWGTRSENNYDQVRHGTHPEASRTHCGRGHEFSSDNTRLNDRGSRVCLACRRERYASHMDEKRTWDEWEA